MRLTINWVKEYAKANSIFLVKTSNGYCVQYQRLIDELTYEDSIGYKECFKTLKETKNWIDDQDPVDVLGISREVANEVYQQAIENREKDALKVITENTSALRSEFCNLPLLTVKEEKIKEVTGYIIGDFVEIFTQTEDIADKTGMHVATKTDGRKIVGFPSHAIARYENVLLNAGYNLMVVNDKELKNELTFDEVREYAQKVFPYLEITDNKSIYDAIMNCRDNNYLKTPLIKEGEEFLTALPLWELNNSNELNSLKFHKLATEYLAYIEMKEFNEVREYAENCGYTLLELSECGYCNFTLYSTNRVGEFTALVDVMEVIKSGRMLNSEFCDLPIPCHKLISLENGEFTTVKDFKLPKLPLVEYKEKWEEFVESGYWEELKRSEFWEELKSTYGV